MGSDLYISIDVRHDGGGKRDPKVWSTLWEGPSTALARGEIVEAFGGGDRADPRSGYLPSQEWRSMAEHPECPWRLDEPYWVRQIDGQEFCNIVNEFAMPLGCGPELRAFAAMVDELLVEGVAVRVWVWHSQ